MNNVLQELERIVGPNRIRQNEPMSIHTAFKSGGPAEYYIGVEKVAELIEIARAVWKLSLPIRVIGSGSSMVVSQKGIEGLVIKNNCRKFDFMSISGKVQNQSAGWRINVNNVLLFAEAGAIMSQVVRFCIEQGFSGLEDQLGLPGTVGGSVCMNSGYAENDEQIGKAVYRARILDKNGEIKEVEGSYFHFMYDQTTIARTQEILLSVVFKLTPSNKDVMWQKATNALNHRTLGQPRGVAGVTFRNMWILDSKNMGKVEGIKRVAYYLEKAGLLKKQVGGAMLSEDPNFIVNMGNATADDFGLLVETLKKEVYKKFGVQLIVAAKIIE